MLPEKNHPASYRDPSGFVFISEGVIYRQVNPGYSKDYELLMAGLYGDLVAKKWLVAHEEITTIPSTDKYKILKPVQLDHINYPYEWSFSQYKDAALLALNIQLCAMTHGMSLKDATPFNIVFNGSSPIFIDTLSFETYDATSPWVAYRQFCESFLAPLLLASYHHPDLTRLMLTYPEGIPLDIAASLLPFSSKLKSLAALHIHLQSGIKGNSKQAEKKQVVFSRDKLNRIITHLISGINSLTLNKKISTWSNYYTHTILQDNYLQEKEKLVDAFCEQVSFHTAVDLGANTGQFAMLLEKKGKIITALDIDPLCIERLYLHSRENGLRITSLVSDLMHPSPGIGWNNSERKPLLERIHAEMVLALALVHHLCIGRNLPFQKLANTLQQTGKFLIIEFVPKSDEKVKQLLAFRKDIFSAYGLDQFKKAFEDYYDILDEKIIGHSGRTLFLMKSKNG